MGIAVYVIDRVVGLELQLSLRGEIVRRSDLIVEDPPPLVVLRTNKWSRYLLVRRMFT